jgi:hypothetical protein
MRKRIILSITFTVLAGALGAIASRSFIAVEKVYAESLRQPYTVTFNARIYATLREDDPQIQRTTVAALRRDGSRAEFVRTVDNSSPSGFIERRHVWDRQTGLETGIYPLVGKKVTVPIRSGFFADQTGVPADCMSQEMEGGTKSTEAVLGYKAIHLSKERDLDSGKLKMRTESWRVPELGCLAVKTITDHYLVKQGQVVSHSVEEATSVSRSEPDARLFAVPDSFPEAKPSEILADTARLTQAPMPSCERTTGARADANYERSRKAAGW